MQLKNYAETAERCQRNFDLSEPIPQADIDYITSVCTTMPTKNNRVHYRLIIINDIQLTKRIYTESAFTQGDKKRREVPNQYRNGQVYSPLLLLWDASVRNKFNQETYEDMLVSIGISSGAAALAAVELGYKTGFCACFQEKILGKLLKKHFQQPLDLDIQLMLGIGMPNNNFQRTESVVDNKVVYNSLSSNKIVSILQKN